MKHHFWPSSINRKYRQLRWQPELRSKKNTFSFFHPKQCKAVRSGCRILYKWQSTGSIIILRCLPLSFSSTILDKTVDTNPLYPGQCWFGVACWAHCHPNFPLNMENVCCNIVRGGRGATDTLFHNKVDLFRNFGGKVPFLSMCQQVLSKIVDVTNIFLPKLNWKGPWKPAPKWHIHGDFPSCSESAEICHADSFSVRKMSLVYFFPQVGKERCSWKSTPPPPPPPLLQ